MNTRINKFSAAFGKLCASARNENGDGFAQRRRESTGRREGLSRARRASMSEARQALGFMAGVNSIFTGDKLLTAANAGDDKDAALLAKLGLRAMEAEEW